MHSPPRAGFILLIGVLAMSSAAILIRLCLDADVPPHSIAAYRLSIASIILAIPAIRQRVVQDYAKLGYWVKSKIIFSGLLLALHFGAWITSLAYTSIVSSVFLVASTPLWIGLLSPLLLKEKVQHSIWVGIGVTLLGSIIIGLGNTSTHQPLAWQGNSLALLGAICAALYLMIGRSVSDALSLSAYIWGFIRLQQLL
jgi:drug/metabolite transporter (DMT)-like permease